MRRELREYAASLERQFQEHVDFIRNHGSDPHMVHQAGVPLRQPSHAGDVDDYDYDGTYYHDRVGSDQDLDSTSGSISRSGTASRAQRRASHVSRHSRSSLQEPEEKE